MSKSSAVSRKSIFSGDQAIRRLREDKLSRKGFAESMAAAIKGRKGDDSLCIALYGQWGSGKTSIKNMILDSLSKKKATCPIVVEFNPWQWSGQEQLTMGFFSEVALALGEADSSAEGKKRVSLFKNYAMALTLGSTVLKGVRFVAPFWGIPAEPVLRPFQEAIDLAKEGAEGLEKASSEPDKPLQVQKAELAASLLAIKKPLLIVLDDIDRLIPDEIRLLFRLVKANGDFPNVTYLMLFHRDYVESSLEGGRAYMEKIVQVGFEVPKVEPSKLKELLELELWDLVKKNSLDELFQAQYPRWDGIFLDGAKYFFGSVREINKLISNLAFYMSMFRNAEIAEINPVDLIAVQIFAVFEPGVYHALHAAKELVTKDVESTSGEDGRVEKTELLLGQISGASRPENRGHVEGMLRGLFPILSVNKFDFTYTNETRESILQNLRICDPVIFDRYFYFDIPSTDIPQAEISALYRQAGDEDLLVNMFKAYIDKGLFDILFDRLEANLQYLEKAKVGKFITALFDLGELLSEVQTNYRIASPERRAAKLLNSIMTAYNSDAAILDAYKKTNGIILPLAFFSFHIARGLSSSAAGIREFASEIQSICLEKICEVAKSGKLLNHPRMTWILFDWYRIDPDDSKAWMERTMSEKNGLFNILRAFISSWVTSHRGEVRKTSLEGIVNFVPTENIQKCIQTFDWSGDSLAAREIVSAWLKACEMKTDAEISGE
ncbi:MAG: hypothetical protein KF784_18045 [Fimbriimonadaceae bacterium]|uniref:KAP family P-loop NTPase fold protein n=1 Tax=Nitrosomonas sp. TaxID=42353 RepID=UPI001D53BBD5|nr:P-loop NTPase fold protein [Nitrosomonas sp.]MBX3120964.1 hypothetical protein [Fimbriimonadaceae bacterium]MBX3618282.1 hypothetical protein [Nitrosomonas sp.]